MITRRGFGLLSGTALPFVFSAMLVPLLVQKMARGEAAGHDLAKRGDALCALAERLGAARREAASGRRVPKGRRLALDAHALALVAHARQGVDQHPGVGMHGI